MRTDHMSYLPHQEQINHDILDMIQKEWKETDFNRFNSDDVFRALSNERRSLEDFKALLSPAAIPFLEDIARLAKETKERHFGKNIYLFTPLYIANYCDNNCIYCGFNIHNKIKRAKLDESGITEELQNIAKTGLREILILTGESESKSPIDYIGKACNIAKKYFDLVGVEIYPINSDQYAFLHSCGVDFVTVFQETYNPVKYEKIHLEGNKRIFPYRFNSQERAIIGGMRGVAFAALLGIDDWRKDSLSTGLHAYFLQAKYPHAEISLSVPRLRPIINNKKINPKDVGEKELLQVIMAYRLFLPFANITLSTRENSHFRDNAMRLGITKVSAGVSVGIGEHSGKQNDNGDGQFEISDVRDVEAMKASISNSGLIPVMSDYIFV